VTFDLERPTLADWRRRWQEAATLSHPWLVSERHGSVVGYATAAAFRPKAAYRTTVETTIYIAMDVVGQGLGRPLYERLLHEAASCSFHLATAGITLPNPASVALHERLGFTRVGVFTEVGHKLGAWRDVGWWQRKLA
jgi:phosphinothricin acetyltransferase